jgi:hypothetical protein
VTRARIDEQQPTNGRRDETVGGFELLLEWLGDAPRPPHHWSETKDDGTMEQRIAHLGSNITPLCHDIETGVGS